LYRPPARRPAAPKARPESPVAPAAEGAGLDSRFAMKALRYHWFLFLVVGTLLAGGLGATAFLLVPSKFTSYALLSAAPSDPALLRSALDDPTRGDFVTYMKTQVTLIKSNQVLTQAVGQPVSKTGRQTVAQLPMLRRVEDPITWLEQELKVEVPENSMVIKISLSGDSPEELRAIVDAVREAYLHEIIGKGKIEKNFQITQLEASKTRLLNIITGRSKGKPGEKGAPADPNQIRLFVETPLVKAMEEQAKVKGEIEATTLELQQLKAMPVPTDDEILNSLAAKKILEEDLTVKENKFYIEKAERHAALQEQTLRPGHPDARSARAAVGRLKAQAEAHTQKIRNDLIEQGRASVKQRTEPLAAAAQLRLTALNQRATGLEAEITRLKGQLPPSEAAVPPEVKAKGLDENMEFTTLEKLDDKIQKLKVEIDAPDRVVTVQPATLPVQKDMKKQLAISGAATLFGFGLVGGLITLFERRASRVFGAADLEAQLNVPLLGNLPAPGAAGAAAPRSRKATAEAEQFTDAVDQVRSVLSQKLLKRGQAVLVAGAAGGEGKSTLALHLAMSLLQSSRKVLLVDCDFRTPKLHAWLGVPQSPGLGEAIAGDCKAHDALTRTGVQNLWLLPAGAPSAQVRQFLSQGGLRGVLHRLKEEFDYVVIDSHAVLGGADTPLVAQQADVVVFAVRRHASRLPQVRKALTRLWETGTRKLGVVLLGES
jgi:Mrp family chromosome partitioning ATPase/capsular polysaccharide biosynthesis protein